MRTRLTTLALAALLALSAGTTPAQADPGPGSDGTAPRPHGSSHHGRGGPGSDDTHTDHSGHAETAGRAAPPTPAAGRIGSQTPAAGRAAPPTPAAGRPAPQAPGGGRAAPQPPGCGAPSGRVTPGGSRCSGLSTPPAPTAVTAPALTPVGAPALTPVGAPALTSPAAAAPTPSTAVTVNPATVAVAAGGVLVLLAMVVAGFRARARLGRMG